MKRGRFDLCFLACFSCLALGCGSGHSASESSKPSRPETKEEPEPSPGPTPAQVPPPALPPAPNPPGEAAYAHFDAAGEAARAVLAADLRGAAPHLAWLSHHAYPERLPPSWRPHATRLQLAARVLARAASPGEAAQGLPALSAACGACHEAIAGRPLGATEGPVAHGDGTLALLEGLSRHADELFASAARHALQFSGEPDPTAVEPFRKALSRAERAKTWIERTAAAQEAYSLCGSCHEALR